MSKAAEAAGGGLKRLTIGDRETDCHHPRLRLKIRFRALLEDGGDRHQAELQAKRYLDSIDVNKVWRLLQNQSTAAVQDTQKLMANMTTNIHMDTFGRAFNNACSKLGINDWYHLPHGTHVLIPVQYTGDSEFIRGDHSQEIIRLNNDYVIKANVKHRMYYGNTEPWFQYILQAYQDVETLVPAQKPVENFTAALEYVALDNEAEWLYMLRSIGLKQKACWLHISSVVIIYLSLVPCPADDIAAVVEKPDIIGLQSYWQRPSTYSNWFLRAVDGAEPGRTQLLLSISCRDLFAGALTLLTALEGTDEARPLQQLTDKPQVEDISSQRRRSLMHLSESIKKRRGTCRASLFNPRTASISRMCPLHFSHNEFARNSSFRDRLTAGLHILDSFLMCSSVGQEYFNTGLRGFRVTFDSHKNYLGAVILHTVIDTSGLIGRCKSVIFKHAKAIRRSYYSTLLMSNDGSSFAELGSATANIDLHEGTKFWPFHIFFQLLDANDKIVDPRWEHRLRLGKCEHTRFELFDKFKADMAQYRDRMGDNLGEPDPLAESSPRMMPVPTTLNPAAPPLISKRASRQRSSVEETSESNQDESSTPQDPFFKTLLIDHRSDGIKTFDSLKSVFGFSTSEYECLLALLSVMVHMRNLKFYVYSQADSYYVDDLLLPEDDSVSMTSNLVLSPKAAAIPSFEGNMGSMVSRMRRGSSLVMNARDLRRHVNGFVLSTEANKDQNNKNSKLYPVYPCPLAPSSDESMLVCCDLLKISVPVFLSAFSPPLLSTLAAEANLPNVIYSPFDVGALHDFPTRSSVYKNAPRIVFLVNGDNIENATAQLPAYLCMQEWLNYERCYAYRNALLSYIYIKTFRWIRRKINASLVSPSNRHLSGISNVSPDNYYVGQVDFQSDLSSTDHGVADSFHNFLRQLVDIWINNRIGQLANGERSASIKLLADLLLNPIGPYYIERLMLDYANDIYTPSFGKFLLNNLPTDAVSCVKINQTRENMMELNTQWGMIEYETSGWKYLFDGHLRRVIREWKMKTQSSILKEIFEEDESVMTDVTKIISELILGGNSNMNLFIQLKLNSVTNDMYSLDVMEFICKYRLKEFGTMLRNRHAPSFTVKKFINKYKVIMNHNPVHDHRPAHHDNEHKQLIIHDTMKQNHKLILSSDCNDLLSSPHTDTRDLTPAMIIENIITKVNHHNKGYIIIDDYIYIHPQLFTQLEQLWLKIINKKISRIQALWRAGLVRQRYRCLQDARKSVKIIQQAYKKSILQQFNYFSPTLVFPEAPDGETMNQCIMKHEILIKAGGLLSQVQKEINKMKEDTYLLSECENMLKREETKINPMETLLSQIVFENLKSPAIEQLATRLTKLKRQEALRRRIIKALKINDATEAQKLIGMLPADEDIILTSLLKLKHDYLCHRVKPEMYRSKIQTKLRSYI